MPFFPIIQAVLGRIVAIIVAIVAVIGVGSIADSPQNQNPPEEINPIEIPEDITLQSEQPIVGESTKSGPPEEKTQEISPAKDKEPKNTTIETLPVEQSQEPVTQPVEITSPEGEQSSSLSFTTVNENTQKALVNVLCSASIQSPLNSTTGSGVIISPNGVVITNAHVAEPILLKNYPEDGSVECILRTGSPAQARYRIELLYISPEWVAEHAFDILNKEPTGTGENDFAFFYIVGRTDPNAPLPEVFPYIPVDTTDEKITTGSQTLAAAYPAGFLEGITIQKNLYIASSIIPIREFFTFNGDGIDLFSLGGSVVSQGGSSGGAAVSQEGNLIGIIVTSTVAETTAERDMRAISLGHINRVLKKEVGVPIQTLISGDVAATAHSFNETITPTLTSLLLKYVQ